MAASSQFRRLQSLSRVGLITVAISLVLAVLGAWFASSQAVAEIDESKLDNYTASLKSYTNESLLIAQQYEKGRSTANYTTVSAEKLYSAVSDLNAQLQTEVAAQGLGSTVTQRAKLATDLSDVLARLSKAAHQGDSSNFSSQIQTIAVRLDKS